VKIDCEVERMKISIAALITITAILIGCGESGGEYESAVREEISTAMKEQVDSWNSGELAGFMKYYWHSEELTFHGGKRKLQGWETLNSMYIETYSGEQRGILEFSRLEINAISSGSAYVLGDWKVELPDTLKQGKFTLIWRKMDAGWRIVHDHSS
jgi:ketosteroid isomerase-like protein